MAGDEATVAKHSLMMRRLGTGTTTTDAKKNKESTNRANLAKESEMSGVYLCS